MGIQNRIIKILFGNTVIIFNQYSVRLKQSSVRTKRGNRGRVRRRNVLANLLHLPINIINFYPF